MNALWMKDRPWMRAFGIAGTIALAIVASQQGFLRLFVLAPMRLEELFYTAASIALVLGAAAVLWDDLLGTREFLMQRPIRRDALIRARISACAAVCAQWIVVVPIVTWVLCAFYSGIYDVTFWAGLPELLATLQIVWPACAIGLLAASLPAPWWLRLFAAATLTLTVGMSIDLGTKGVDRTASPLWFAIVCWAAALMMSWLAAVVSAQRADPDRPWQPRTRVLGGAVLVVSLAYTVGALAREGQSHSLRSLQWQYPRIARIGDEIRLAARVEDWTRLAIAGDDHQPTADVRPSDDFRVVSYELGRIRELLAIEPPRFHSRRNEECHMREGRMWLSRDGRAWMYLRELGAVRATGVGAGHEPLPRDLRPWNVDDIGAEPNRGVVVVGDRSSGKLWRFDRVAGHFVIWPLPDGDAFQGVRYTRASEWRNGPATAQPLLQQLFANDSSISYIRGERRGYAIKDGELLPIDVPSQSRQQQAGPVATVEGEDRISYAVEVPAHDGLAAYRHEFTPRTWAERGYAANAMALAVIRPPVTQVVSHLFADDPSGPSVWLDRVVCGGKRTWLLLVGIALSAASAVLVRRRLRRLGAEPTTCTFWTVAIVATGPVTSVLPLLLESARSHARHQVLAAPKPRIVSVREAEESVA